MDILQYVEYAKYAAICDNIPNCIFGIFEHIYGHSRRAKHLRIHFFNMEAANPSSRKSRIGAQLEPGLAQKVHQEEVHQEEAGEDQVVQVHHLDLRHLNVKCVPCKNNIFRAKRQIRIENMLNMHDMQHMQNIAVDMICRICRI